MDFLKIKSLQRSFRTHPERFLSSFVISSYQLLQLLLAEECLTPFLFITHKKNHVKSSFWITLHENISGCVRSKMNLHDFVEQCALSNLRVSPHPDLRSAHSNRHANSEWENHGNGKLLPMVAAPTPSPSHVRLVRLWLPLSTVLFVCGQNGALDNSLIYCIKSARPYDGVFYRMQN